MSPEPGDRSRFRADPSVTERGDGTLETNPDGTGGSTRETLRSGARRAGRDTMTVRRYRQPFLVPGTDDRPGRDGDGLTGSPGSVGQTDTHRRCHR